MAQTKKKHHYIPQFYIEGFTNNKGEVFVLEHATGKINKQSKYGTFHKYKFYSVDFTKHPKRDPESAQKIKKSLGIDHIDISNVKEYPDMIEDLLSDVENISAPIIKKLIKGEQISTREKMNLSTFIALMYTRTPAFHSFVSELEKQVMEKDIKKIFSQKEKVKDTYNKMLEEGYEDKIDLKELFKFVEDKKYKIGIPKELTIQYMLIGTSVIDRLLYKKTWFIMEAPTSTSFITSDNPVFMNHPIVYEKGAFSVGVETPNVEVFFPLSKELLLVMKDTKDGITIKYKKFDRARVRNLNKLTFFHSGEYVVGRDLELVERLNK